MDYIYCSKCGEKNSISEDYCIECGSILRKLDKYESGDRITSFEDMFTQKHKEQLNETPLTNEILGEGYFNDSLCEVFRKYLVNGKLDDDFEKKINFKGINESINYANNFHYFALIKINNTLFSRVILYDTFISIFIVSENTSKYNLKRDLYEIFNESND